MNFAFIGYPNFELLWPWMLIALPLPWLVRMGKRVSPHVTGAPRLPLSSTLKTIGIDSAGQTTNKHLLRQLILFFCWLLLVVAICRPHYVGDQVDIPLSGRDLMLAVDISPSMKEKDMLLQGFQKTRLEVVKHVVSQFVEVRKGDRMGLILFGSQPYIQAPLTFDVNTVNTLLDEAFLGMAGQSTAIGDAIALGVKRLRQRPDQSRVLILLTDGANTTGEIPPEKAAQLAEQENVKVYTIGIGADEMYRQSFFGTRRVNPSADLDEGMLMQIAQITGGQYFRARNTGELEMIYENINLLEPVEQETRSFRPSKALHHWFIGAASLLYFIFILFSTLPVLLAATHSGGARPVEAPSTNDLNRKVV